MVERTATEIIRALGAIESVPVEQRIDIWRPISSTRAPGPPRPPCALDRQIFETVQNAMPELGFAPGEARPRAGAMVYLGIGFIHGRGSLPAPTAEEARAILGLSSWASRRGGRQLSGG
ncbi:hypothetical protein ABZ894_01415 [Nocardia beijingensis]|uniref:hypothetical protein n=1 Tax=Nocardia beijingensis TaxID=95162 RepID=UPI0033F3A393